MFLGGALRLPLYESGVLNRNSKPLAGGVVLVLVKKQRESETVL